MVGYLETIQSHTRNNYGHRHNETKADVVRAIHIPASKVQCSEVKPSDNHIGLLISGYFRVRPGFSLEQMRKLIIQGLEERFSELYVIPRPIPEAVAKFRQIPERSSRC